MEYVSTLRNSKKKMLPKHHFYAILAEETISFTNSHVEHTLSKNLLGNDMYNTVYVIDDVDCVNHLVNDHFHVTSDHLGTNRPIFFVCQMEYNIWNKSGMMRNSLHPRLKYKKNCTQCQLHAHDVVQTNLKLNLVQDLCGKSCYDI